MEKLFNFNHEEYVLPIDVNEETGAVTMTIDNQTMAFDSVQALAEAYAVARNVTPENLKNWVLVEDDNTYAFILRAATAGNDEDEEEDMFDEGERYRHENELYRDDEEDDDEEDEEDDVYDEDEYCYEDDYHYFSDKEKKLIAHLYPSGQSVEEAVARVNEKLENDELDYDELVEQLEREAARLADIYSNLDIAIIIDNACKSYHVHVALETGEPFDLPNAHDVDEANKRFVMAKLARRKTLSVLLVNLDTREVVTANYPTNGAIQSPFVQVTNNKVIIYGTN